MITIFHKGKSITTSVGSSQYNSEIFMMHMSPYRKEGYVPAGYAHRPDLIANLFFETPSAWWRVMELNGLFDPFESLKLSDKITL